MNQPLTLFDFLSLYERCVERTSEIQEELSMSVIMYRDDERVSQYVFRKPLRMPEPGDIYSFVRGGVTLGDDWFDEGDLLLLHGRTEQRPFNHISSEGNWVVSHGLKGRKVSIWSGIELMMNDGDIKLVATA